ncbi:MAG: PAS domain S-box protein, partial [Candidatus Sericytochromatia bacterium]
LIGKTFRQIFPKDYIPLFEDTVRKVIDTGYSKTIEYDFDLEDGKRYFKSKISKIDNNNVISFINDITESKSYTEEIKKKEALIDPIINSTDDIIFSTDNKFKITTFNNSFRDKIKLFYNKDINIGQNIFDIPFFKEFEYYSFEETLKNISLGLKINNEISIFYEGKNYYFSTSVNPIVYEDKIIGLSVFAKDITSKKETELELIKQKETFENILDKLPIGIFQKDRDGNYTYVNKIALNHISKDYSDVIGKNSIETFKTDVGTIFTQSDKALREGTELFSVNEVSLPKENQNNTYMIGKILLDYKDPINSDIIGFSIDITDKKNAEVKLLEQKEKFENVLDNLPIGVFEIDKNNK